MSPGPLQTAITAPRAILHVDMDAFFAAIEALDDPSLLGKPVIVGGQAEERGVVAACSYEARKFGIHSAMSSARARRLCPQAIVLRPRFHRYAEISRRIFALFDDVTPLVEPLSIDEAFLDVTGCQRLFGPAATIGRALKERIKAEVGLNASVGVAPNKFLAKLASDLRKPDGLVVVTEGNLDSILLPLPVERIWGVGPKTAARLHELGFRTVADLRAVPRERLAERFGEAGEHFFRLCRGLDDRPVVPAREAKQHGQECTFEADVEEPDEVRAVLREHVEEVARRLRRHGIRARGVTLKIRYGKFETITRSALLEAATDVTADLRRTAMEIFDRWAGPSFRPVRLIGMTATHLETGPEQAWLFPDDGEMRQKRLDAALDEIRAKFGRDTLRRGPALP
jgi:DNA polymerase-4